MNKVVSLIEYRYRETIGVLRYLLRAALMGELAGIALIFRIKGKDEYVFTGEFKTDHASTLKAATRIGWKMNKAMDRAESSF